MILRGRVWRVGDDLKAGGDIVPTRYDHLGVNQNYAELAQHVFEDVVSEFRARARKGDLIVAGRNFGSGHAHFHGHAINALIAAGLGACIAESYAGAFQRRAINSGFPAIESRELQKLVQTGDELEVNLLTGEATNLSRDLRARVQPLPPMIIDILTSGGLERYAVQRLKGT